MPIRGDSDGKEPAYNAGDLGLIPGLGRSPGREQLPTPTVLPGEFHGQRSLVGYSQSIASQRVGHDSATKPPPLYMIENDKIFHHLLMFFYVLDIRISTLGIYTPNIQ